MIKVEKTKNQMDSFDFEITNKENTLTIMFGGTGDLYFYVNKNNLLTNETVDFIITKENYSLFSLFEELYNQIVNCDVFKVVDDEVYSDEEIEDMDFFLDDEVEDKKAIYSRWNKELRQGLTYKKLVSNGVISWRNDDQPYDEANMLNIYKEDEQYRLEFIPRSREMSFFVNVRIRNSGSNYAPFNMVFMRFYQELQNYDPKCHQIHMEECLYQKRLELRRK